MLRPLIRVESLPIRLLRGGYKPVGAFGVQSDTPVKRMPRSISGLGGTAPGATFFLFDFLPKASNLITCVRKFVLESFAHRRFHRIGRFLACSISSGDGNSPDRECAC